MNIYFISDTHFGHYNIIRHCTRPWPQETHDDMLIQRWNAIVSKKDIVYHLGDFAMFKSIDCENRMKAYRKTRMALNGKIHLVVGNHDKMSQDVYNCFTEVYPGLKDIVIDHNKITLCHYPMRSWNGSFHGSYHIFAHVHGRLENVDTGVSCDVGVDVPEWNYAPVAWETLKIKLDKKKEIWNNKYTKI